MTLEQYIKNKREAMGLTQGQIASHLQVKNSQFVSNFERGRSRVPTKHFKAVARVLKIDLSKMVQMRVSDVKRDLAEKFLS